MSSWPPRPLTLASLGVAPRCFVPASRRRSGSRSTLQYGHRSARWTRQQPSFEFRLQLLSVELSRRSALFELDLGALILDRGSTRPKAQSTAGQGLAPGASHEERAGEQTDAADEAGASDGASPLICVLAGPR